MRHTRHIAMTRLMSTAVTCLVPALAAAQSSEPSNTTLERWHPGLELESVAGMDVAERPLLGGYDLWLTLGRVQDLLQVTDDSSGITGALVGPRYVAYLGGSMTVLPALQVGASLPVVLYQARGDPVSPAFGPIGELAASGVGDLAISGKYHLLSADTAGLNLAAIAALTVPTRYPRDAYLGERNVTASGTVAASRKLSSLELAANLGYYWRPSTRFLDAKIGPEIRVGLGARYDLEMLPLDLAVAWQIAMRQDTPLRRINESPSEILFEATYRQWLPFVLSGGVGIGLIAGIGTPDVRFFLGARWAHRPADADGDRIPDEVDRCPARPEDYDGYDDRDGCPDLDNDGDGIPDVRDECPDQPENKNGYRDEDGCPDSRASLQTDRIAISGNVHFEVNKAVLKLESRALLDEIAQVLKDNPQIKHLRIEGHTDSDGGPKFNFILSRDRAVAVRDYLIQQGIDPERLTAVGYGQTRPLSTNRTAAGRALNRRVEFVIEGVKPKGRVRPAPAGR